MSTTHSPKQMALEAYAAHRLSAPGSRRLERHMHACAACQRTLEAMQTYAELRAEAQHEVVPELSWERLERALDQRAEPDTTPGPAAPAQRAEKLRGNTGKLVALAWPVLALAATFVFGYLARSERTQPELTARSAPAVSAPIALEAESQGWITLVAGQVELEIDGARSPAQPGQVVHERARIFTGRDAEAHVALSDGSGLIVSAEAELSLGRLREHSVALELRAGEVFQRVHKLGAEERYEVSFGPYLARVRGTRFQVRHGESASVAVSEGRVEVFEGARRVADLSAGQSWSSRPDVPAAPARDRQVHAAEPASASWPTLALPPVSNVASFRIDGAPVSATGGLSMRVPAGDVTLSYEDRRGHERTLALQVAPEGSQLEEAQIRALIAAQNDPRGHLDPEQIAPVVRAGLDALRRCYERGLKRDPGLIGKLVLSIRVAPDGHVARAELGEGGGPRLPLDVEGCLQGEARRWLFPKPTGGSVMFEVPLNLKSAH